MTRSVRLGRIAGLEVGVNWSVVIVVALLTWNLAVGILPEAAPGYAVAVYWVAGLVGAALLLGSLLAHELAHAVVARNNGVEVKDLTLWLFGGVARLGGEPPTPQADLRIAGVGPATSFGLSVGFGIVSGLLEVLGAGSVVVAVATWLSAVNLVLAVFNLLPGAPLDGGRVLRAFLWRRSGDWARAATGAARAGKYVAYVIMWFGFVELFAGWLSGAWMILIGWFVLNASQAEQADITARHVLGDVTVRQAMTPAPRLVPGRVTIDALVESDRFGRPHSAYPVEGPRGEIVGLVTLQRLRTVPPQARATTLVSDVAVPLDRVPTASPDEPLVTVLERDTGTTGGRILVFDGDVLVGLITATDVAHMIDARSLRGIDRAA